MITQHTGKLTIKEIEAISGEGDCLSNFYYTPRFPNIRAWWINKTQIDMNFRVHGFEIALAMGTPNCNMRGYESYPGAWVFYDTEYNIRWLVFSDGIRKNHYKGTSYELTIPETLTEKDFAKAIIKFFNHFGFVPMDENKESI